MWRDGIPRGRVHGRRKYVLYGLCVEYHRDTEDSGGLRDTNHVTIAAHIVEI